jgi:hypothetical protein
MAGVIQQKVGHYGGEYGTSSDPDHLRLHCLDKTKTRTWITGTSVWAGMGMTDQRAGKSNFQPANRGSRSSRGLA